MSAGQAEAIQRVKEHAPQDWLIAAEGLILNAFCAPFTSDDIWELLADAGYEVPHEKRAMGAVLKKLAREKKIVATGRWVASSLKSNHGRPQREWKLAG